MILLLLACAKPVTPTPVAEPEAPSIDQYLPAPLAERPFTLPTPQQATLKNGLRVMLVENHETPFVWGTLAFSVGGWADPPGKEGLNHATMAMTTLGAGSYDAIGFSAALRRLGSSVVAHGGLDGASLSFTSLTRNLEPTLSLTESVLTTPTFPEKEWEFLRGKFLDQLDHVRNDPGQVASRVLWRVMLGDRHRGRVETEAAYNAITLADMKAMHKQLAPTQSLLLIGGDVTMEQALPALERHFGAWQGAPTQMAPIFATPERNASNIQLVDFPGKAQSVVKIASPVGKPTDPDHDALSLANTAIGGQFTARINMNLREQRGWTYGARSSVWYDHVGAWWSFNAGIQTAHTGEAISETLRELRIAGTSRPLEVSELDNARDSLVMSYPLSFENTGYLLGQERDIWMYGLRPDEVSGFVARMKALSLADANAAWKSRIDPDKLLIVVAGDAATVRPQLEKLGLPIVERTADGELKTR